MIIDVPFVTRYLRDQASIPGITFKGTEADHDGEDGEVKVFLDGRDVLLSVQVGGGYLCLNQYGYTKPGDSGSFYSRHLWSGGVQPGDLVAMVMRVEDALRPALNERKQLRASAG